MTERELQLQDRVAELEELLGVTSVPSLRFVLRVSGGMWLNNCEAVAGMLLQRQFLTREAIYTALYGMRAEAEQPDPKMVAIIISRLRFYLRQHDISIETRWGLGYFMTAENKAKLRALLDQHKAAQA